MTSAPRHVAPSNAVAPSSAAKGDAQEGDAPKGHAVQHPPYPVKEGAMPLAVNSLGDPTGWAADGTVAPAVALNAWIEANRHMMKPPVSNKYLYSGEDFFVMIIAGPNARNDFHMTNSEEFFIQLKGDIVVRIRDADGVIRDVTVREGETFFIPPNVPHSPMRGPDTIGLVVERRRPPTETEHIMYFCEKCGDLVYDKEFACADIVVAFSRAMEEFWADPALCTCTRCGTRITKPAPRTQAPDALRR